MNCHTWRIRYSLLSFLLISIFLFAKPGFSDTVSMDLARHVASNFLNHIGAVHTIESIETMQRDGTDVAYLVQLSPQGYILVAGDDIRVPIKGYSLTSNFSNLPEPYVQNLLRELEVRTTTEFLRMMSIEEDETNVPYWEYLSQPTEKIAGRMKIESYTPDTFLLTSQWNQTSPYNKLTPTIEGEHTLTGCVQTAIAQVMRYHAHPATGSGVFTHDWNSQTLTAVMNRPFNWDIMPDKVSKTSPAYQQDEVAALMRDLGILNKANFGLGSTSTTFHDWLFDGAFGYAPISYMTWALGPPEGDTDLFFTTIRNEIDSLRPLLLSLPGHMVVADGYSSDETGRNIHINLGWGGAYDNYYYLDQTIVIGTYSYDPDHAIYYNIRPCDGDECDPYDPTGGEQAPVIESSLPDIIIDSAGTTLRIEIYDPDADTVTLSASSSCGGLEADLDSNLLTLTPLETDIFCQVDIQAHSYDGTASKTFNVLCLEDMIYLGAQYDISGQFADRYEVDEYLAYLEGDITVSGYRGYSNQAFYIWIEDQYGNIVLANEDPETHVEGPVSGNLDPGIYTIAASMTSPSSGWGWNWDENYSNYILSVTDDDLTYTVSDLADSLGISLSVCELHVTEDGDGNGTITSSPAGIDCPTDCDETYDCGTEVTLTVSPDGSSMFTGWSGDCTGNTLSVSVTIDSLKYCTATFELDADQDSMPDAWETAYFGNTSRDGTLDYDDDDLTDLEEYQNGTDPNDSDTDDDGLYDGEEINTHGTDPIEFDTDGDGVSDFDEVVNNGTNPNDESDFTPDGTGVISGTVMDATGNPITGYQIIVKIISGLPCYSLSTQRLTRTDPVDGTYTIANIEPNSDYFLWTYNMKQSNYVNEYYTGDADDPSSYDCGAAIQITVNDGDNITGMDFELEMGGSISGMVYESDGTTPIPDLLIYVYLETCGETILASDATGLSGEYTIYGLPAGDIYVETTDQVLPPGDPFFNNYVHEWYDNALDCNAAAPVAIIPGGNSGNINFQLEVDNDYDQMSDEWETTYFGDTSRDGAGDYDADGLTDIKEYQNETNPLLDDTDDDGIPDGWEVQYSLDPLSDDASSDPDNDGYTNLQEYREGGDPNSSDSPFPWELFYPAFTGKK